MAESKGKGDIQEDEGRNKAIPKASKTTSQPESSYFDAYKKKDAQGGVAVIINNINFDKIGFVERTGSTKDVFILESLLNKLNFQMIISDETTKNLSGDGIKEKLEEVSGRDELEHACCFVCIILSYGDEGHVYGTKDEQNGKDGKLEINDIMEPFKGDKCQLLIGTPKLFFVQTCPKKHKQRYDDGHRAENESGDIELGQKIPVEADQLLVHSCIPGDKQWDKNEPSWFISELRNAITDSVGKNSKRPIDFLSTLAKMNGKLVAKSKDEIKLPYTSSTLRKDVVLRP